MKLFYRFLLATLIITIFSCQSDPIIDNPDDDPGMTTDTTMTTGEEDFLNLDSDFIFNQDSLFRFDLVLSESALATINNDPAAEEYVEGSLIFRGETLSPVGIRYKGSIGAFVGCVSGSDWANPSGFKTCTKLSMKIKINWLNSSDKFYGLKKLQFHSQNLDDSQMHDRLGYWLYREMGVPAPRAVHAKLYINGIYSGLFSLVEQIDGRFTNYHFEKGNGNLYKEVWPLDSNGNPLSDQQYLSALKTNEDQNPSAEMISSFAQDLTDSDGDELADVVSNWMNISNTMAHFAVDRTIRHDDGPFHWYCGGNWCSNHNFYWYEDPESNKMVLIPWDLDNAFENIVFDANPVTPVADDFGETRNDCKPFNYGSFFFTQRSATCDKVFEGLSEYEGIYEAMLQSLKSGPLSEQSVNEQLDKWSDQIRNATEEASILHDDAVKTSEWESAVLRLKQDLAYARNN